MVINGDSVQKIQVMVEDNLALGMKNDAKRAGLSISSYARLLITSAYKKNISPLEKALIETDGDLVYSGSEYLKGIQEMIKNA